MSSPIFISHRRAVRAALLWCGLALMPVLAANDDALPSVAASDAPAFSTPTPSLGLRPPASNDETTTSAETSPAPTASSPAATTTPATSTPSQNVTVNLINLMVKRGLITREDADTLIKQAEQEADIAKAQAATTQAVAERALTAQQTPPPAATTPAQPAEDEVQVNYVPDVVKNQIRDEVTQSVMKQTREENLVAPDNTPDWVKRFHVTGDIRVRYEDDMFPSGNAIGNFANYNAINTGSGINVNPGAGISPLPNYDVDQNRERFRLRTRLGAEIDLDKDFTAGLRIATGSDNQPVTENQTMGGVSSFTQGQGGDFSKYSIWLDRAFIRYERGDQPNEDLSVTIGRFDNPFISTPMIWADDIGFDGAVVQGRYEVAKGVTPFLTAGAFPVFNTDFNFSSTQQAKFSSEDKYLFAAQSGTKWKINDDFTATGAVAYYDFENIEGKVSSPIPVASSNDVGNTDDSRPSFAQNGNTYIALRDFEDPAPGTNPEIEYYGLATPFHDLAVTAQLDYGHFDPFHLSLTGEFVDNLAFDRNAIINGGPASLPGPQNNLDNPNDPTSFVGGDMGWMTRLRMGKPSLEQLWDWNAELTYRYVQSDATVDAFTDADFGVPLYGTNLKGYTVGGNLALSHYIWTSLHWMSADSVAGPIFKSDLLMFDINAKF